MELKSGPVNCLLCLKSLQTHKPLKWHDVEFVEGIASACCTTVNNQLSVIFLLRKLLEIPAIVCGELLESYGDPYFWISCCDYCSVIVDKGQQIYNQIVLLQKQLENVKDDLKVSICKPGESFLNYNNAAKGATGIVRSYIKKEMQNDNVQGDTNISGEVDKEQLHDDSPLDYENGSHLDITDVKIGLEIVSYSPQSGNNLDMPLDENMLDVKPSFETVPQIGGGFNNHDNNSHKKDGNSLVENIADDLNTPSGGNWEATHLNLVTRVRKPKKSKQKRIPSKCDICGKKFPSPTDLRRHQQRTHTEKTLSCNICGKGFSRSDHLKNHARIHTGDKPFKCDICGKSFSESGSLKRHSVTHTGEKRFVCGICGKASTSNGDLNKHLRIHTGERPFKCETCGKTYSESGALKAHLRTHGTHTREKVTPCKCDICGKGFFNSVNLKRHNKIVHTGEKPFKCELCAKRFIQSQHLKKHLQIHSGERPFKCDTSKTPKKHKITNLKKRNTIRKIKTTAGETPKEEYILP